MEFPDVPTDLRAAVDGVIGLTDRLLSSPASETSVAPQPKSVSILGGRGQGKSTALAFAADGLRRQGVLVLSTIDPERFAPGDTLFGWVLAELESALGPGTLDTEAFDGGPTIRRLLDDLSRSVALVGSPYREGLARRGVTPEEFARDAARVPTTGSRLLREWSALLEAIARARGDLRVVVPIDDADLYPHLLQPLLVDARLLTSSPRVATVMAADPSVLEAVLGVHSAREMGESEAAPLNTPYFVHQHVHRQVVKHFPRPHRILLHAVPTSMRLEFTPVGKDKSLGHLLEEFPTNRPGVQTLLDFFVARTDAGDVFTTSDYTRCLSDNRRDLQQLFDTLDALPRDLTGAEHALAFIIKSSVEGLLPNGIHESLLQIQSPTEPGSGRPVASLDFRPARFGREAGYGSVLFAWTKEAASAPLAFPHVAYRAIGAHYMTLFDQDGEDHAGRSELRGQLTKDLERLSHAMFLAWEALQDVGDNGRLFEYGDLRGRLAVPGGQNWVREISSSGQPWNYWTVPAWECFSDYFLFGAGLNHLSSLAAPSGTDRNSPAPVEFLFVAHLCLLGSIQLDRRIPAWVAEMTAESVRHLLYEGPFQAWCDERLGEVSEIFTKLMDAKSTYQGRSGDFQSWLKLQLLRMVVPMGPAHRFTSPIIALWETHTTSEAERRGAIEALAEQIGQVLTESRADAEIAILELVHRDRANVLRDLRTVIVNRRANERADFLGRLSQADLPRQFAEQLEAEGATPEVLNSLAMLGFGAETLAYVSRIFPVAGTPVVIGDALKDH